jgi:hypothetical protein
MTCIVGIVSDGKVLIGGDSAGVDGSRMTMSVRNDRKVFRNGEFVMGFTSSFRMGQLLAFSLSLPKPREDDDLFGFMVRDFIGATRSALKDGGFAKNNSGNETGGEFLVGFRGRLFRIFEDFQVAESISGYDACGCGDLIALGSLFSTSDIRDPQQRITVALQAAETFSAGVRGPFFFETTEGRSA